MSGVHLLTPDQVAQYLRRVGIRPANLPPGQQGAPAAGTNTAGDGYWQRFGSANHYGEEDPNSFPDANWPWLKGGQYNESVVFNATGRVPGGTPGATTYDPNAGMPVAAPTWQNPNVFTAFPFSAGQLQSTPSPLVVPGNPQRSAILIQNLSGVSDLFVNFGAPANANLGVLLVPQGSMLLDVVCPNNDVYIFFPNNTPQPGVAYQGTRSS